MLLVFVKIEQEVVHAHPLACTAAGQNRKSDKNTKMSHTGEAPTILFLLQIKHFHPSKSSVMYTQVSK